ncbi:Zinc/iron permease [Gilbertella persicaria]|uniref:Zinc/iron permease n=1 Tax=Gilbertella persicaria TaxID=101096 RepID=UPI00221F67AD|nr:Zinc/iron permease [Gilbertella persicaria]KAI8092322.1 Zinc/iron permease [Gilbertella persicaria]
MEAVIWLLLISIAMFFGSYLSGSLPLTTSLSEQKIHILNALGVGLLISTSLVVVIPEGIETIYDDRVTTSQTNVTGKRELSHEGEQEGSEHTAIGLALITGFALMLLIDQLSSLHVSKPSEQYSELSTAVGGGSLEMEEEATPHTHQKPSLTPTIGLIVHAAADGIALGASANHPDLSMVVFLAIMLHKAPASFALASVLLGEGLSHRMIKRNLFLFAIAAPIGSLLTYFTLHFFSSASSTSLAYWTGVLLVFSGGTFLYVAMHSLQEIQHTSTKLDKTQLLLILSGMTIPVLLGIAHSH